MEKLALLIAIAALCALLAGMLLHSLTLSLVGATALVTGALLVALYDLRGNDE